MIKVSVLYPYEEGKKFDMEYYCNKHMPMVKEKLGDVLKGTAVEEGRSGLEPGSNPTYIAMGHMYFDSLKEFQNAFGPHAEEIRNDLPNYTVIEPIIQISEVKM